MSIGNEMFHNAHEPRREIGILTALGATTRTISVIFMMKAVFLALFGSLLGYGTGTLVAFLLAPKILHTDVYPSLSKIYPHVTSFQVTYESSERIVIDRATKYIAL
jgi:ABC-type antimicrobial peptide transport system permease subunit